MRVVGNMLEEEVGVLFLKYEDKDKNRLINKKYS